MPPAVPGNLAGFDEILRDGGNGHYDPSPAFYRKVSEKYSKLDLEEEALKVLGWLKSEKAVKLKRTCNSAFILNWLKNASREGDHNPMTTSARPQEYTIPINMQTAREAAPWAFAKPPGRVRHV